MISGILTPYVIAGERGDYYVHSLDMDDHDALFEMCKRIDIEGGKFMISYDDHDYVNDTYKDFIIKKIPIKYPGKYMEMIIKMNWS